MDTQLSLEEENATLRDEIRKLNLQIKKLEREARVSNSFVEKVVKAFEAKDTLSSALSAANTRQKAYTGMLLEYAPSVIILLDEQERFVLSTSKLLQVTNTPNFDFIKNRSYEDVFNKYFSKETMQMFKSALERTTYSDESVTFDAWIDFAGNGFPRFYSIELRRVGGSEEGLNSGTLALIADFTDLMIEKQRAEAASNAKTNFLATMSHEIRTPMNAIFGMSTALSRLELSAEHRRYISDIRKASDSLLAIINDILDFSKIEAGKMEIVKVNYSPLALLDNLRSMFSVMYEQKNLTMECNFSSNLPEKINGDENRLRQILANLLSNSLKYTKKGGVVFSAWADNENNLRFEVKDTGIGIREEDIDKLFKPFEQLDARKNRNIVGTGLGLAICYNLCHIMNGEIGLDTVYGEGTTFYLSLPYELPSEGSSDISTSDIAEFSAPSAKVLVVDDMEINLTVAELMLDVFRIIPDLAESGMDAIDKVRAKEYDLIFMDYMMPEIDGLETTRLIRELGGSNDKVPIIALTANATKDAEQLFLSGRMNDMLTKPMELNALNLCLRKWLPGLVIEEA